MLFDRLYGKTTFPKIIGSLLNCPGILRLREIRMGNVPFLAFPSFAACTRYEHSIGVCHLAELAALNLGLEFREEIELMIASLYHDIATPPFGHTIEEIFRQRYGFDHEQRVHDLITGRTDDLGRERAQIFQGRGLKLQSVIQKGEFRELKLDLFEIADFAVGKGRLGSLIAGTVDLDNIDNVVRATSALGICEADAKLAETLASSFLLARNEVLFSERSPKSLETWQRLRHTLYSLIYNDIKDFSLETMIRHAARILTESEPVEGSISQEDWSLTEEEIIFTRFMKNPVTKEIAIRIRNADTYACLALFSISTPDTNQLISNFIPKLEESSRDLLKCNNIISNYHVDKRLRSRESLRVHHPLTEFLTDAKNIKTTEQIPNVIVGVFTPERVSRGGKMREISDFEGMVSSLLPPNHKLRLHLVMNKRFSRA